MANSYLPDSGGIKGGPYDAARTARTWGIEDDSGRDSIKANNLTIHAANKTNANGTGDGGNLILNAGSSYAGTQGTITIGTVGSAVTITPALTLTGALTANGAKLTAGTMTESAVARVNMVWSKYSWTNAMVVALGAATDGDITVCTLPAKTIVHRCVVVIGTPDTSANALTVSVGTNSTDYDNYIVDVDAKGVANTIYGDAKAEVGVALKELAATADSSYSFVEHIPSWTATTAVKAHFTKTATNLNTVTGSTGSVYLLTSVMP